jgi:uncharacterized membrane-anchored protein YjiN (DUF445 family)
VHDLLDRVRLTLAGRQWAPAVATAIEIARHREWDEHLITAAFRTLSASLERPAMRDLATSVVEDLLERYRQRVGRSSRFWLQIADLFGLIDPGRIVASLQSGAREVADDAHHPLRRTLRVGLEELPGRLRTEPALAARVDSAARELLEGETLRELLKDLAAMLQRSVLADVDVPRSTLVEWVAEHLEHARLSVIADEALRRDLDRWVKRRLIEAIERNHGRISDVIEKGVLALGPDGAVRLIEEHAGDDLQYIRVNGTVVGGLAGGAIYGVHLLLGWL